MELLSIPIVLYFWLYLNVVIHELAHYYASPSNWGVNSIVFGFDKYIFLKTVKNNLIIKFSLLPLGGYVEFNAEQFDSITSLNKIKSFLAGPLINLSLGSLVIFYGVTLFDNVYLFLIDKHADKPLKALKNAYISGHLNNETTLAISLITLGVISVIFGISNLCYIPGNDGWQIVNNIWKMVKGKNYTLADSKIILERQQKYIFVFYVVFFFVMYSLPFIIQYVLFK